MSEAEEAMDGKAEQLLESPPSVKLVYYVLSENEDPMKQTEISEESRLKNRTTRYGLRKLTEIGIIEKESGILHGEDARSDFYSIKESYENIQDEY